MLASSLATVDDCVGLWERILQLKVGQLQRKFVPSSMASGYRGKVDNLKAKIALLMRIQVYEAHCAPKGFTALEKGFNRR